MQSNSAEDTSALNIELRETIKQLNEELSLVKDLRMSLQSDVYSRTGSLPAPTKPNEDVIV